jgi:hypothetical protein
MDYTKIPQSIVYKKRENLVDFFNNDLNKTFVKNMQEIDILLESDFEAHALICMNAAYYICTLIMLEEYPTWRLTLYDSILCHLNLHPVEGHKKIVFSLVYLMLKHYDQNWQKGHSDFLEKLYEEIYPEEKGKRLHIRAYAEGAPRDIFGTLENHLPALVLPNDEFAPRTINNDVVREMKSTNFDWAAITDYYKDNKVKEIIESVGKNLEEKRYIIEILIDSVLKFYTGDNWYKTERMKMLHGLMKEYGGSIEENDQDESDTVSVQYAARIRKLEEENRQLKGEKAAWEAEKSELIKKSELPVPSQEWFTGDYDELPADEIFTLRERLVFFSTVLSLEHNKKYTVAKNLETFIKELCNDQKGIGILFSRMKKPDEMAANGKAAKKVANLMKLIIPKEYRNNQRLRINQLIESMLLNYPESDED